MIEIETVAMTTQALRVCAVTLGDGRHANALGERDWLRLRSLFRSVRGGDDVTAVLLRGTGSTFTAGSDMHEWLSASEKDVRRTLSRIEDACTAIEEAPIPVIAQILGVAAGAGCQLALACDFQLVATTASIGMPILRFGLLPSRSFTLRLMEHAGAARARELLMTGRMLSGPEAVDAGLATHCAPDKRMAEITTTLLETLATQPAAALAAAKRCVLEGLKGSRRAPGRRRREPTVLRDRFHSSLESFLLHQRTGGCMETAV